MRGAESDVVQRMVARFGNTCDAGPAAYLRQCGYTPVADWYWRKPGVEFYGAMTQEEFECLLFLILAYDSGGLLNEKGKVPTS
ncbi:MAG TPA: hypothetical protein VGM87_08370 [Roseomonas sp.]|jgi:hypothetical protein